MILVYREVFPQDGNCLLDVIKPIGFSLSLGVSFSQLLGSNDVVGHLRRFYSVARLIGFVGFGFHN